MTLEAGGQQGTGQKRSWQKKGQRANALGKPAHWTPSTTDQTTPKAIPSGPITITEQTPEQGLLQGCEARGLLTDADIYSLCKSLEAIVVGTVTKQFSSPTAFLPSLPT